MINYRKAAQQIHLEQTEQACRNLEQALRKVKPKQQGGHARIWTGSKFLDSWSADLGREEE
jgi:hypothetical protein